MKALLIAIGCVLVSFNSSATVHDHINPVLNFDNNYEMPMEKLSGQYLHVSVEEVRFKSKSKRPVFDLALSVLEEVMNSEEFKWKVLAYKNSSGKREYQKNYLWKDSSKKLSNEDVYNLLMEANEKTIPDTIGTMNIYAKLRKCRGIMRWVHTWCRNVVGSTNPHKSVWMTLNWKFYRKYKASNMVANIVHEWIHLLGFLHGKKNMREEVPYVVGKIAGEVARGILEKRELE